MLIPARKLIAVLVGSFFGSLLVALVLVPADWDEWTWVIDMLLFYVGLVVGLGVLVVRYQADPARIFGARPARGEILRSLLWVVPLVLLALGTIYLVFLPLSFVAPEFVESWLFESLLVEKDGRYPIAINAVIMAFAVLIVPFVEELFFRGFLFRRLERKWSFMPAVLLSSALFALPHVDLLGAFCFGIVMTLLYARLQSLWIPIALHTANNLAAFLLEAVYLSLDPSAYTVTDFQAEWWWGAVGLVVGGGWFVWFVRRWWPRPA